MHSILKDIEKMCLKFEEDSYDKVTGGNYHEGHDEFVHRMGLPNVQPNPIEAAALSYILRTEGSTKRGQIWRDRPNRQRLDPKRPSDDDIDQELNELLESLSQSHKKGRKNG
jgi:hypothetical protein